MNQRNTTKRQISVYKFLRVSKDPRATKVKGLYSRKIWIPEMDIALEAYVIGEFIYMWRKCDDSKQTGNKIKTYFVRYKLGTLISTREYIISGGRV